MASAAIAIDDASKLFLDGAVTAFRQLTLSVAEHESVCLVGPSGCGKTTLRRGIAGLTDISAGRVLACIWAVNEGFERARAEWTHENEIALGDIPKEKRMGFEQIVDMTLASEAGGRVAIGACKD